MNSPFERLRLLYLKSETARQMGIVNADITRHGRFSSTIRCGARLTSALGP
jgi:hypothetical protein